MISQTSSFVSSNLIFNEQARLSQDLNTSSKEKRSNDIQSFVSAILDSPSFGTGSNLNSGDYRESGLLQASSITEVRSESVLKGLNDELIKAVSKGDVRAVEDLINAGANVNADIPGDTKDLYAQDKYQTVLILAARRGNADIVKALISAGADVDRVYGAVCDTALQSAAQQNHADIVEILIAAGADIEAEVIGSTALIKAAGGKYSEIGRDSTINAVNALIVAGANVNATDWCGGTALMEAARKNNVKTVLLLIESGADVHMTNTEGLTALDLADRVGAFDAGIILYRLMGN